MEELSLHLDNARLLAYVSLVAAGVTIITHLIFKKYRAIKYLPGLIFIGIGMYNLFIVLNDLTASDSINSLLLFLMGFVGGFIGLFIALIIGIYNKPRKVKKSKVIEENQDEIEKP